MPILSVYILKKQIKPFFLSILLFLTILLLNRIFELVNFVIGKGVPVLIVLKMLIYSLPFILSLVIPMAVMVSVIVSFGDMSEKYEIIGMQSAGINLRVLFIPLLVLYFVLFIGMVLFNDLIVPESNKKLRDSIYEVVRMKPASTVEEGRFFTSYDKRFLIFIDRIKRNNEIDKVYIREKINPDKWRVISSEKGIISFYNRRINLTLFDGKFMDLNMGKDPDFVKGSFDRYSVLIPLEDSLIGLKNRKPGIKEMNISMLLQKIDSLKKAKFISPARRKNSIYRYYTQINREIAVPFAAVVFLFVGMPIGILIRKGSMGVAIGAGLIIFIFYYALLIAGEQLSYRGLLHPVISMWLPNLVVLFLSIPLFINAWRGFIVFYGRGNDNR